MRVPEPLSTAFGADFEALISRFAVEKKLLAEASTLNSVRFLARSVVPHIQKLSGLFNRIDPEKAGKAFGEKGLDPYWKESSNPKNFRLAYFLYFMPCNLYRTAAIWTELGRLGFRWAGSNKLKALELGAGPAAGACGIAAGEAFAKTGLPRNGNWALIEQDKSMLELGSEWATEYFRHALSDSDWGVRNFHRTIEIEKGLLPRSAPKFNLWVASYFLNESSLPPEKVASVLMDGWEHHLEEEGIAILVEPALKLQSRKLLAVRKALLEEAKRRGADWFQILLPCLGHQACGALAAEGDWCHEEVSWWRPPYFRVIDRMAGLDRKTLPFSYLVVTKSRRSREEILPALAGTSPEERQRLVSPSHSEGKELEFFLCGQEGKRRARYRPQAGNDGRMGIPDPAAELDRGDILLGADIRGDVNSSRVQSIKNLV